MGEVLSKEHWDEQEETSAGAAVVAAPAAVPAVPAPAPPPRRRVKVKPSRVVPASGPDSLSGSRRKRQAAKPAAAEQQPVQPAAVTEEEPASDAAADQLAPLPAPAAKRKGPEPSADAEDDLQSLAKRHQLLGLTILTIGALMGMAPFAPPRPAVAAQVPAAAKEAEQPDGQALPGPHSASPAAAKEAGGAPGEPLQPAKPVSPPAGQAAVGCSAEPVPAPEAPQQEREGQGQEEVAVLAATLTPVAARSTEETGEALGPEEDVAPPLPLSSAKPISRTQLRQQLLQSQRSAGAASLALRPALAKAAGPEHSAAARSTRGQRLLGLVRRQQQQQQHSQQQLSTAREQLTGAVAAAAVDGCEQMQLDTPEEAAVARTARETASEPEGQTSRQAGLHLAQRRLTQSPLGQHPAPYTVRVAAAESPSPAAAPVPAADGADEAAQMDQASPAAPVASPEALLGSGGGSGSTTPRPQRTTPPTPLSAEPSSTPRPTLAARAVAREGSPASPAPAPAQPCANTPSPTAPGGTVEAALQQVGDLLGDLRADSPGWQPIVPADVSEPHCKALGEGVRKAPSAEDKAQGVRLLAASLAQQQGPGNLPGAVHPSSPQDVCSKPLEARGDNFPGFWRPAAAVPGSVEPETGGKGRRRKRAAHSSDDSDSNNEVEAGRGRARRVRFRLQEPVEAAAAVALTPQQQQQQQPGNPTPLPLAPPVLPSGSSSRADGRPATPAKPAQLPMPQPPPFSRFGAAAFRRPYAGPQGRRQALLSYVSDSGATCFAVPPGVPAGAEADAADAAASGTIEQPGVVGELFIPRRLQHHEGMMRRRGNLQPEAPSLQGPQLLQQEVREAFINSQLADHAGQSWARLDMAGCELLPGVSHAESLAQLSARLEESQGAGALALLLGQLDFEWQHLKRVRQYATQGAQAVPVLAGEATAAAAAAEAVEAAEGEGAAKDAAAGRSRGILKHRSSLSHSGDGRLRVAVVAAAGGVQQGQGPAVASEAAGLPSCFEAVLAASIVTEAPSPKPKAPAIPAQAVAPAPAHTPAVAAVAVASAAAPSPSAPSAAAPKEGTKRAAAVADAGAAQDGASVLMDVQDTLDDNPPASTPAGAGRPQAAAAVADPAAPGAETSPAECQLSWEPRHVELTPGPELSRGTKLLQRLGTPQANSKAQQLHSAAKGALEYSRRQTTSPFAPPVKLAAAAGGGPSAAGPLRRAMSRGERLLAVLRSGSTNPGSSPSAGACTAAALAARLGGDAAAAAAPQVLAATSMDEDGPTVAPAAAVLLSN